MSTKGFTIVELLVALTVAGILIAVLFGPLNDLYTSNINSIAQVTQVNDTKQTLHSVQKTIETSTTFLSQNDVSDPSGKTWNNSTDSALITSNLATTIDAGNDPSANRTLVLNNSNCSSPTPLQNNYVFFVSGGKLYRRTLTQKGVTATCNGAAFGQKQTCAAGASYSRCEAVDALLVSNVKTFTIQYYTAPESASTTTNAAIASTVSLSLTLETGAGTNKVTTTGNLRVSHLK